MCGIFGVISKENYEIEKVLNQLELLEYRGYDSAGFCALNSKKFQIEKNVGLISGLLLSAKNKKAKNIISHTRWATHGEINLNNTHPHVAENIALVHNGIIDNHKELITKFNLQKKLKTNCDSEVIAHLVNRQFEKYGASAESLIDCLALLKGSYSLLIQNKTEPNTIYGGKLKSPLYVGITSDGFIFSSDLIAFQGLSREYFELEDAEYFVANHNKEIEFFNAYKIKIKKKLHRLENLENSAVKGNFSSFLEKEINDIPPALSLTSFNLQQGNFNIPCLKDFSQIHLIGCGTAYHSACLGKYVIESSLKVPCFCHIASEFLFEECLANSNSLFIFISQSGETYDTLECVQKVRDLGFKTLGITNTLHSQLSKLCDFTLPIFAGKEVSVASTKVFNCLILAFYFLCGQKINIDTKALTELIERKDEFKLASLMTTASTVIFIGKCEDNVLAMESALKFRELTYHSTLSYPCGELKHGTLSIIDENTLSIAILTQEKYSNAIFASLSEIKTRKGKTALITNLNVSSDVADIIIKLPNSKITPINLYSIIPMQKLSFFACSILKLNPDRPRNLAKSVTVH